MVTQVKNRICIPLNELSFWSFITDFINTCLLPFMKSCNFCAQRIFIFKTYVFLPWECLYFSIFFALHFCFVVFSIKEYSSERSFECITGYAMWHNTWNTYLDSRNVVHSIMLIYYISRYFERITLSTTYHRLKCNVTVLFKSCLAFFLCGWPVIGDVRHVTFLLVAVMAFNSPVVNSFFNL